MDEKLGNLAWNLFTELRKELVSLQTIRAQIVGFKIAFVSTGIAIIASKLDQIPPILFVIPGFAAIFFDLLIHSYSYSIKRTGIYCRIHLEPILRKACSFPENYCLWEGYLYRQKIGKNVSFWGSIGITILAVIPAIVVLFKPFSLVVSPPLFIALIVLVIHDIKTLYKMPPNE